MLDLNKASSGYDRRPLRDLGHELAIRVDALVPALLPLARRAGNYWTIGSVDGEKGDSLYIWRAGQRAGKWSDAATGQHGDLLDLIAACRRLPLREAAAEAAAWLGQGATMRPTSNTSQKVVDIDAKAAENARGIWTASQPLAGTIAETYFRWRGIAGPLPVSLRFAPRLWHGPSRQTLAAAIAACQQIDGTITAIQRIFLKPDGAGKADVEPSKMSLGTVGAGAVHLGEPENGLLGLAEGIETGLSASEMFRVPVWAALGSRLEAVALPASVRRVIIFGDNDDPGRAAAQRAVSKLSSVGVAVEIRIPPSGNKDWNDAHRTRCPAIESGGSVESIQPVPATTLAAKPKIESSGPDFGVCA